LSIKKKKTDTAKRESNPLNTFHFFANRSQVKIERAFFFYVFNVKCVQLSLPFCCGFSSCCLLKVTHARRTRPGGGGRNGGRNGRVGQMSKGEGSRQAALGLKRSFPCQLTSESEN